MSYQTILFDLDGTVIDSRKSIFTSINYALDKMKVETNEAVHHDFIGPPLHESFAKHYQFTEDQSSQAVAFYREYYEDQGMYDCTITAGYEELLPKLKFQGKKLYIATAKPQIFAKKIIDHHGLDKYFEAVIGCELDLTNHEKAKLIKIILDKHPNEKKESFVMVGDRNLDIIGAKKNGIDSIAQAFAPTYMEELIAVKPTHLAKSIKELEKLL